MEIGNPSMQETIWNLFIIQNMDAATFKRYTFIKLKSCNLSI